MNWGPREDIIGECMVSVHPACILYEFTTKDLPPTVWLHLTARKHPRLCFALKLKQEEKRGFVARIQLMIFKNGERVHSQNISQATFNKPIWDLMRSYHIPVQYAIIPQDSIAKVVF